MEQHILQISKGVTLEDGKTAPAKVRQVDKTTAEIILHEGKNRIVRRIFNSLGYKIRKLERIQVGSIKLGKLESGKYTELTPKQIASF